jgi:hypothetical protein
MNYRTGARYFFFKRNGIELMNYRTGAEFLFFKRNGIELMNYRTGAEFLFFKRNGTCVTFIITSVTFSLPITNCSPANMAEG